MKHETARDLLRKELNEALEFYDLKVTEMAVQRLLPYEASRQPRAAVRWQADAFITLSNGRTLYITSHETAKGLEAAVTECLKFSIGGGRSIKAIIALLRKAGRF